jgi:hypothetical protein
MLHAVCQGPLPFTWVPCHCCFFVLMAVYCSAVWRAQRSSFDCSLAFVIVSSAVMSRIADHRVQSRSRGCTDLFSTSGAWETVDLFSLALGAEF